MKSALNEKCFHGFGSIFGRIWVHILGGNAYVFENTSTISRCCEKCFQKRKVLSKTKTKSFRKMKSSLNLRSVQDVPAKSSFKNKTLESSFK